MMATLGGGGIIALAEVAALHDAQLDDIEITGIHNALVPVGRHVVARAHGHGRCQADRGDAWQRAYLSRGLGMYDRVFGPCCAGLRGWSIQVEVRMFPGRAGTGCLPPLASITARDYSCYNRGGV